RDLFQRSEILAVDIELVVSIRQLEVRTARLRDYIELSTPRFLKCRKRLGSGNTAAHKIFSGERDQLLNTKRLIHKRIGRNVHIAMDARFAGNTGIVPRVRLPYAVNCRLPTTL